jgi:hypothetical protein
MNAANRKNLGMGGTVYSDSTKTKTPVINSSPGEYRSLIARPPL